MTLLDHPESSNPESSSTFSDSESLSSSDTGFSNGEVDDLASTSKSPQGISEEMAQQRLSFFRENAAKARLFYEADRTLEHEDRTHLFNAYRLQMFSQYGGALAGLAAGVTAPRYICGFAGVPFKLAYSSIGGLIGVLAGYSMSERAAYNYSVQKYQSNQRYLTILKSTKGAPPVIGYTYYQETLKRPDSTLPDPSKIDWNKYPAFPLVLVAFGWYRSDIKGLPETGRSIPYQQTRTNGNTTDTASPRTGLDNNEDQSVFNPSGYGVDTDSQSQQQNSGPSTWDMIRQQNKNKPFKWETQQTNHSRPDSDNVQYEPEKWQDKVYDRNHNGSQSQTQSQWQQQPDDLDILEDPYQEKDQQDAYSRK